MYNLIFIDGWKKASALSCLFGFDNDYLSQCARIGSLPKEWGSMLWDGTWYIKPPICIIELIESGYTATKVTPLDDVNQYDMVISIGRLTSIGFWR